MIQPNGSCVVQSHNGAALNASGIVMKRSACLAALLLCLAAPHAHADYPERAITLIVPAAAGGNADITARLIGQEMSRLLGQPVVVENRVGAGGRIGTQAVVRAPADGYTIGYAHVGTLVLHRYLFKQQMYDLDRDEPVLTHNGIKHVEE